MVHIVAFPYDQSTAPTIIVNAAKTAITNPSHHRIDIIFEPDSCARNAYEEPADILVCDQSRVAPLDGLIEDLEKELPGYISHFKTLPCLVVGELLDSTAAHLKMLSPKNFVGALELSMPYFSRCWAQLIDIVQASKDMNPNGVCTRENLLKYIKTHEFSGVNNVTNGSPTRAGRRKIEPTWLIKAL